MRNQELVFPPAVLFLLLASFYILNLISCTWAINLGEALYESQKVFLGLCTVAFFLNYIRTDQEETHLVKSFLWILALVCLWVSIQLVNSLPGDFRTVTGLSENLSLNASLLMLMMAFPIYAIFFFNGGYLLLGALLLCWLLFLISFLNVKSVSLASSVALIMVTVLGYNIQTRFRKKKYFIVSSALASVAVVLLSRDILSPLMSGNELLSLIPHEKQIIWKKTWNLFLENPWLGVGAANWPFYFMKSGVSDLLVLIQSNIRYIRPENDLLWVLAETGLVCFIILLLKMVTILYYSGKAIIKNKNHKVLIFFSFLCALITYASFSFPKERITHIVMACLLLALLLRNLGPGNLMTKKFRFPLYLGLIVLFSGMGIGAARLYSETQATKMRMAKKNGQAKDVISFGKKALHVFYETQSDGRPVAADIGNAYLKLGNADSASYYFKHAIGSSPYDFEVFYYYSRVLEANNDPQAQNMLEKALNLNPELERTLKVESAIR